MKIDVKLRKKDTGEEVVYHDDFDYTPDEYGEVEVHIIYMWTEGNYSCDCNRELFFCRAKGVEEPDEPKCSDDERYLLISITESQTGKMIFPLEKKAE